MIKRNKIVYFVSNLKNERNPKCTLEYDRLPSCSFLYCFRPYFWIRRSYGIVVFFCLVILVFTWWRRCLTKVKLRGKKDIYKRNCQHEFRPYILQRYFEYILVAFLHNCLHFWIMTSCSKDENIQGSYPCNIMTPLWLFQ